jgi:hypothetical protein
VEARLQCVSYAGVLLIILLSLTVSSLELSVNLTQNSGINKYYQAVLMMLILTRFTSFGLLFSAMARIRRVLSRDQFQKPNIQMMLLHLCALFGFLLSNIPYGITIATQFGESGPSKLRNMEASFYSYEILNFFS